MKQNTMTNTKARKLGKKELGAIFKALRHKDGLTEKAGPDEFTYWYNRSRDGTIGNYIVYEAIDSDAVHRADDTVISRDFFCQIDVFSIRSFETKQLNDMINNMEEKLTEGGFEVLMREEEYESGTKLYHIILFVSKLYFFIGGTQNGG